MAYSEADSAAFFSRQTSHLMGAANASTAAESESAADFVKRTLTQQLLDAMAAAAEAQDALEFHEGLATAVQRASQGNALQAGTSRAPFAGSVFGRAPTEQQAAPTSSIGIGRSLSKGD